MDITNNFQELTKQISESIGIGESYDTGVREIKVFDKQVNLYFLTGLVDSLQVIEIIKSLLKIPRDKTYSFDLIKDNISHHSLTILKDFDNLILEILNGMIVVVLEGYKEAISIDVRNYPNRSISEPEMEKVIRGSHDGFNENFHMNIQLMRRRIKDGRLRNELFKIGTRSPAYVCLSYLKGVCEDDLIEYVRQKLNDLNTEHLIMADKALEEMLIRQEKFNPYPLVRYTERADTVAIHLYQGMFAIFVDTSPSVILAPCTFFDHVQHTEEYRQTPISGTYLRLIRFLGILMALFLTPIWLILVKNDALWGVFKILNPSPDVKLNIYLQIIAAELGVEFLRMASIHTPSALSTTMGLIAGVLLGDIAVSVGLFSIQTVLLVALSAIGTYVTPSYELALANKISKLFFIVAIYAFGWIGFVIAFLIWIIYVSRLKSFRKPYFYPLIPFDFKRLLKIIIRYPYHKEGIKQK